MTADQAAFQILLASFAGWVNREQAQVIDYLREENRILKEQLRGRRLRLTDAQRRRLAAKGRVLGRRLLQKVATIVTPDTILRWHRRLIAAKWTYVTARVGRPGVMKEIRHLVVRFARENSGWGYSRIQGALKNLGHQVCDSTIANIMKEHGLKPAPDRPTSWRTFLKSHFGEVAATDFFTTEVWTPRGLTTYYTLFVIDLKTRRVCIGGTTPNPDDAFMAQVARNLTDIVDGFLLSKRFLICDRDTKFSGRFRRLLSGAGVEVIRTPFRAPNANAYAELFVRSIKEECLNKLILFGEGRLRDAIQEFVDHYHSERNHQGLGNELIEPMADQADTPGQVSCRERLGGLLKFYYREVA